MAGGPRGLRSARPARAACPAPPGRPAPACQLRRVSAGGAHRPGSRRGPRPESEGPGAPTVRRPAAAPPGAAMPPPRAEGGRDPDVPMPAGTGVSSHGDAIAPAGFALGRLDLTSVAAYENKMRAATADRRTRVVAWTLGGERVGLAGVGEGTQKLSFPSCYEVGAALRSPHWARALTPTGASAAREQPLGWRPKAIVFRTGRVAAEHEPIGLEGPEVTVLPQHAEPIPWADRPCADLSGVSTPDTPSGSSA